MDADHDILDNWAEGMSENEKFTPLPLVRRMLDLLPPETWTNPEYKFLDPCVKSGRYLTEAGKRLNKGLAEKIPDRNERLTILCTICCSASPPRTLPGLLPENSFTKVFMPIRKR